MSEMAESAMSGSSVDEEIDLSSDSITEEIQGLLNDISFLQDIVDEVTYDSFTKVINYYQALLRMSQSERRSDYYGLTSTYALLLLNSTYDVAIKEVFRKKFENALLNELNIQQFIGGIIDRKILNKYMTNIKHEHVKKTFELEIDNTDPEIQNSIRIINDLIDTRNKIAHGLETSSKGHNDLKQSLISVIYYLNWYSAEIENKLTREFS